MASFSLGLFPLNLVLFPDTTIPIHIFEPRYIALINECMEFGLEFGINLVEKGRLFPVGCSAKVVNVTDEFDDGRLDIIVQGMRRFNLVNLNETSQTYATGTAEELEDDVELLDGDLLERCSLIYNNVVDLVYGSVGFRFDADTMHDNAASFFMAPKSGLSLDQKQALIEMTSENQRLEVLLNHLTEIIPTVRQAETLNRIIRSDGYLPAVT
ncbi:MAG: LON peptidase substrate-binding domain-containing protein [Ignavibacteria bacterium]|nr:LON peptidase substrate-binding domain-containing protein [Ignavibacteria bacterium]